MEDFAAFLERAGQREHGMLGGTVGKVFGLDAPSQPSQQQQAQSQMPLGMMRVNPSNDGSDNMEAPSGKELSIADQVNMQFGTAFDPLGALDFVGMLGAPLGVSLAADAISHFAEKSRLGDIQADVQKNRGLSDAEARNMMKDPNEILASYGFKPQKPSLWGGAKQSIMDWFTPTPAEEAAAARDALDAAGGYNPSSGMAPSGGWQTGVAGFGNAGGYAESSPTGGMSNDSGVSGFGGGGSGMGGGFSSGVSGSAAGNMSDQY